MPIKIEKIEDQDLTVFTVTGQLPLKELWSALTSHFEGELTANHLWDLRKVEKIPGYTANMEKVLAYVKNFSAKRPSGKTALVTSSTLGFGFSRMTDILSEALEIPWEMNSFQSLEEAVEWLKVDYPAG